MARVPWFVRALVVSIFLLCAFGTILLLLGRATTGALTGLGLSYVLSSVVFFYFAWLQRGRLRRGWFYLGLIPLFILTGNLMWTTSHGGLLTPQLSDTTEPSQVFSLDDIFFVAVLPFSCLAFFGLLSKPRSQSETPRSKTSQLKTPQLETSQLKTPYLETQLWQRRLDIAICVLALAVYGWRFAIAQIVTAYAHEPFGLFMAILEPSLLLIPISLALFISFNEQDCLPSLYLPIFALALMTYALGSLLYYYFDATGLFTTSSPINTLPFWSMFLFACSGWLGLEGPPTRTPDQGLGRVTLWLSALKRFLPYLPYLAMAASFALLLDPSLLEQLLQGRVDLAKSLERVGVLVGTTLISALVIIRQVLTMRENHRLNRDLQVFSSDLEERVEERTQQLEDSRARLAASERLASLGRISAGLAHEINTPVAAAMNSLRQAQHLADEYESSLGNDDVTEADHHEIAQDLKQTLARTDSSLERLGEFVRRMRGQVRTSAGNNDFDAVKVIKDSLAMLEHRARKAKVTLSFGEPAPLLFYGDAARFSQVISNLVVNALDACEEQWRSDSTVTIRVGQSPETLVLEVADNGVGIPESIQAQIFEPLFTTKDVGKGTGLGLAIIQDIIYGHFDGTIELSSVVGEGTTFRVFLPKRNITIIQDLTERAS
jgi:signal transduction histidine kinase